jgi:nicotinate phosphoribosyltransferase
MGLFDTVSDQTIRDGGCTDIYFVRTEEALAQDGINPKVAMEVTATALPDPWAVFCGLSDVIALLQGMPVTVDALPEGTVFYPHEPVLRITGRYRDFCRYETTILGFLCHASGIATAAAQIRYIASGRPVFSFGSRRQAPRHRPDDRALHKRWPCSETIRYAGGAAAGVRAGKRPASDPVPVKKTRSCIPDEPVKP